MAKPTTSIVPTQQDLVIEMWLISRPVPYSRNARNITQSAIDKVAMSIKEFGWQQPIVVDADGVIIAGHTRLLAAKKLGLAEVPVRVARNLTPAQVKAYRLMDNRSHEEATWDDHFLKLEVLDLAPELDLKLTGFSTLELGELNLAIGWDSPLEESAGRSGTSRSTKRKDPDALEFRVIIECESEDDQTELLERFRAEGLRCKALIS